jgi:hypothetical protein
MRRRNCCSAGICKLAHPRQGTSGYLIAAGRASVIASAGLTPLMNDEREIEATPPRRHRLWLLVKYAWALPNTVVGLLFVPCALWPRSGTRLVNGVLEVHGPLISRILQHVVPLRGGASAMTFGHIVVARDRRSLEATRRHERVHVRQCEIWGPAFVPAYLIAALWALINGTGAYTGNYFERQAFATDEP